eukprot:CAMPEP_0175048164 /NCGR_PEP_ID=MMETSP0052_2-20121109/6015_1 /TAXON_ID=51329 ORGANISM="Polytomella parva, Strain SAG 63-3" /NCGR_SAMPLE_ID=MMETSP0052_2 /ASSEMBLY_ACC=CAM_ASM_000194 /LENGTH=337 /DNA_ID=CAMNT_0016312153 /DNA_START=87 /DNA_END=1097 /DNA_ORIENTATION=+
MGTQKDDEGRPLLALFADFASHHKTPGINLTSPCLLTNANCYPFFRLTETDNERFSIAESTEGFNGSQRMPRTTESFPSVSNFPGFQYNPNPIIRPHEYYVSLPSPSSSASSSSSSFSAASQPLQMSSQQSYQRLLLEQQPTQQQFIEQTPQQNLLEQQRQKQLLTQYQQVQYLHHQQRNLPGIHPLQSHDYQQHEIQPHYQSQQFSVTPLFASNNLDPSSNRIITSHMTMGYNPHLQSSYPPFSSFLPQVSQDENDLLPYSFDSPSSSNHFSPMNAVYNQANLSCDDTLHPSTSSNIRLSTTSVSNAADSSVYHRIAPAALSSDSDSDVASDDRVT